MLKVPCHAFPVITHPLVCYVAFSANGLQSHNEPLRGSGSWGDPQHKIIHAKPVLDNDHLLKYSRLLRPAIRQTKRGLEDWPEETNRRREPEPATPRAVGPRVSPPNQKSNKYPLGNKIKPQKLDYQVLQSKHKNISR